MHEPTLNVQVGTRAMTRHAWLLPVGMLLAFAIYYATVVGPLAGLTIAAVGASGLAVGRFLGFGLMIVAKQYGMKHMELFYVVLAVLAAAVAMWLRDTDVLETVEQCASRKSPSPNPMAIWMCAAERSWETIKVCAVASTLVGIPMSVFMGARFMGSERKS